jgi:hypothetical protein
MVKHRLSLRQGIVLVYATIGLALLPWTLYLLNSLEPHHVTDRWDLAWSGFDTGLACSFLLVALAAWRRSVWVGPLAAATATLLVVDAWFDVVLGSHGSEEMTAVLMALFAELPAAAVCLWIAVGSERYVGRVVQELEESGLHLAATGKSAAESDLIGVLEVAPDGEAAREPRDADTAA